MNQLGYCAQYSDRELTSQNSTILFSKNLAKIEEEIHNKWIEADFSHDGNNRTDYYFSPSLSDDYRNTICFAAITKRQIGLDKPETLIKFVAPKKINLIQLALKNNIPFDAKKMFSTFNLSND